MRPDRNRRSASYGIPTTSWEPTAIVHKCAVPGKHSQISGRGEKLEVPAPADKYHPVFPFAAPGSGCAQIIYVLSILLGSFIILASPLEK
jgi:hypothetical protein